MGRLTLIARLVARDLRHRPSQAVLLLLAITAATTMLTLGLVLHGVTQGPYQRTRAATAGPDLVASVTTGDNGQPAVRANLLPLAKAPGVTAYSGPFPVSWVTVRGGGNTASAEVQGRDEAPSAVDRPLLTAGSWIRPGGVVVERSFAAALGVGAGDTITLNGRVFHVSGIAVSAAVAPYPGVCATACVIPQNLPLGQPGLVWMTRADLHSVLRPWSPLTWNMYLRLADPATAGGYANAYDNAHTAWSAPTLWSWQHLAAASARIVSTEQDVLLAASPLLGLLAVAGVAVLAGGRMAGQTRRVGLLKAAGGGPGLVAVVLLAEHLLLALVAAAAGLALGWLAAPLLTSPGAGLLGSAGPPSMTLQTAGVATAAALAVAVAATFAPAVRGARVATASALAGAARPPKRRPVVTRLSRRMPVVALLGMRIAARRPRRTLLSAVSVAITVAGVIAVIMIRTRYDAKFAGTASSTLANPLDDRVGQVLTAVTVALIVLAAVNALLTAWATVLDARRSAALSRALGVTPGQVSAGLAVAQMLPALAAAIVGVPLGLLLYSAVKKGDATFHPDLWWLAAVVIATPLVVGALTAVPARLAARESVVPVLQSEAA
jgi:ABC-type lipoprotein release transport system permease subunit